MKLKAPYTKLTRIETVQVGNTILAHCIKDDLGHALYEDNWDDERIHRESNTKAGILAIRTLRRELVGKLFTRNPIPTPPEQDLQKTIKSLSDRLSQLESWASKRPVVPFQW